jgi:hypothetical protein
MKKVGLSLSFCVRDIIEGKVSLDDVAFIYSGTKAETAEHWDGLIYMYSLNYWSTNPSEGERLARHFIDNGLIIQPRLEGKVLRWGPRRSRDNWIDQDKFNDFCEENLRDSW